MKLKSLTLLLIISGSLVACAPRLAENVRSNIESHPNLGAHQVEITNQQSTVRLSGTAQSEATRAEIERLTRATPGVETVRNNITVIPPAEGSHTTTVQRNIHQERGVSDQELQSNLQKLVEEMNREGFSNLTFQVSSGTVTFRGEAENHTAIDRLLADVNMLRGVQEVKSEITINGVRYMDAWKAGHRVNNRG